jgi:hypothetical protein
MWILLPVLGGSHDRERAALLIGKLDRLGGLAIPFTELSLPEAA